MTLIAGFQAEGIPILLGDFLLTANGEVSGIRKKIHRVSPNFVIAWTGHLIAAKSVLNNLQDRFAGKRVSKDEVEFFLINYFIDDLGGFQAHFIAWVVDDDPYCFLWNSAYSQELFYEDYHIDGSGRDTFLKRFASCNMLAPGSSQEERIEAATQFALILACELISDEVVWKNNQKLGFGHAYEILYYDGNEFKYLDNATYLVWECLFDENSKCTKNTLHGKFFKYLNFSDFSVVEISELTDTKISTDMHIITPIHNKTSVPLEDFISEVVDLPRSSLTSDFLCIFFGLVSPEGKVFSVPYTIPSYAENPPISLTDLGNALEFNINFEFIEFMYKTVKADAEQG